MRTWVLCLVVGLVCLIAVSIATLILQLPPDLFNSTNADPDDGPRLQSDQGKRQEFSFAGLNGDTGGAIEEEGSNVAVQSLLDPQTTSLSSGLLPERNSPDSKDSGRDRFGNHNNLETNLQEPAVVDIILQTGDELLPPPPPSVPKTTEDGRPLVFTTTGKIAGFKREILGKKLNVFLGIPYATPPVDDLRFRKPQPIQPWSDVYDASDMGPPCFHITYSSSWSWAASRKTESEDCLHLNVWAPEGACDNKTKTSTLKPVIVFIYGGGFNIGATDWEFYDGSVLAAYGDVVMASMNYRLGPLGFLNADSEDIPGNMGLLDQHLAIRWLYENAPLFCGNPAHMVLVGESAGAVSAGLHLVSPMSRHMVKRVVLQSGSPLWDTPDNTVGAIKKATEFAEIFKCSNTTHNFQNSSDLVVRCLRELDARTLFEKAEETLGKRVLTYHPRYGDEFMPLNAHEALKKGLFKDSDVLLGVNKDEGSIFVANSLPYIFLNGLAPNITKDEAAFYLIFFFQYIIQTGTRDIRDHYFKTIKDKDYPAVRNAFIEAIGDYLQICPTTYYGETYSRFNNSVYYYHFTHRPSNSYWPEWLGTAHFDEVEFIFGVPLRFPEKFTAEEVNFSKQMMDIWLTFAKTGKPPSLNGTQWPLFSELNPVHMELNPKRFRLGKGLHAEHCRFWKKYILK